MKTEEMPCKPNNPPPAPAAETPASTTPAITQQHVDQLHDAINGLADHVSALAHAAQLTGAALPDPDPVPAESPENVHSDFEYALSRLKYYLKDGEAVLKAFVTHLENKLAADTDDTSK